MQAGRSLSICAVWILSKDTVWLWTVSIEVLIHAVSTAPRDFFGQMDAAQTHLGREDGKSPNFRLLSALVSVLPNAWETYLGLKQLDANALQMALSFGGGHGLLCRRFMLETAVHCNWKWGLIKMSFVCPTCKTIRRKEATGSLRVGWKFIWCLEGSMETKWCQCVWIPLDHGRSTSSLFPKKANWSWIY